MTFVLLRHFQSPVLMQGLGLVAPSSVWTKVQPVVRSACHTALQLCSCPVGIHCHCEVLVGLNSLHFFTSWRDVSSQQLLPTQQEEGQCPWICWRRIGCGQGPLGSHTSPGTLLSEGFGTQALPQVCTVLTQWTATCCSGGTPENVIAKSCVELVRKKITVRSHKSWKLCSEQGPLLVWTCSSLESAAVTAADAFLHPWSRFFADCSFISVRNAAGCVELCVKDFCYSCTQN